MSSKSMIYVITAVTVPCALQTLQLAFCTKDKKVDMQFFDDSFEGKLTVVALYYRSILHAGCFPLKGILWWFTDI
jgi:hypothetical protein